MVGKIAKEDIEDLDVLDRDEARSDGTLSFKSGVTVVSTTSGTKRVIISGFDLLLERDTPIEPGDKVTLAGTSGGLGNGTFTINVVVNATTFDVVETIGTSTGGTVDFKYAPGAKRIGIDSTGFIHTTKTNVQEAMKDLDTFVLPVPDAVGQVLYALDGTTYTKETPLVADQDGGAGWLINDDGVLLVTG